MKGGGKTTKLMEREDLFMLMGMSMMDIGRMTKHTGMVCMPIQTVPDMRAIGKKISSLVKVSKHGLMVLDTREIMLMVKNTEEANSSGQMAARMMAILLIIILKEKV
jgi:hypothetical protein